MKRIFIIILIISISSFVSALSQTWLEKFTSNDKANFYDIQNDFNRYMDTAVNGEKRGGYKQYKRWEWYWEKIVQPDGIFPDPMHLWNEYKKSTSKEVKKKKDVTQSTWNFLGPETSPGGYYGLGRVNCVRTDPKNQNTVWAGTPSGGLWKSTNAGGSWTLITDDLLSIGVTDITFHPDNPSIMYIATGDGDAGDTYSVGVLKSTDGGVTWSTTGLNWSVTLTRRINRLLIDPNNPSVLYAATSNGVYKTTNAGSNWTQLISGNYQDMEFKPNNYSTIYISSTRVFRSTDAGSNWIQLSDNFPTTGVNRVALGVTPADNQYIYALLSSSASTFYGLYRSTNDGDNWEKMSSTPNILGRNVDGSDNVGQGWYDLCIAVSQSNKDMIFCGGINTWRSTNGGSDWQIVSMWYNYGQVPTIHADQHDLFFIPSTNTLYAGNDGGVYRTTNNGLSWSWLGSGLGITQFYKIGVSQLNVENVIAGAQDNGTKYLKKGDWYDVYGGDGTECFIDYSDEKYVYASMQYGSLYRSTNGGNSFIDIKPSGQTGAWVSPFFIHPSVPSTIYACYKDIFISTNRGTSWKQLTNFGSSRLITVAHIAPANPDYIYIYDGFNIRVTKDGGTTWTSYSLPTNRALTYIISHPEDPEKIYASFSGYTNGEKCYVSDNSGSSWNNISYNLPNIPMECLAFNEEDNEKLFIGTDWGIYFIDKTMSQWQSFNEGLPNVMITEMEIHQETKTLFASSYGRGVWSRQLSSLPKITFQNPPSQLCLGETVSIDFSVTNEFNPNNLFILQLSDRFGNFDSPVKIGELNSIQGGTITGVIPKTTIPDTNYKLRITSNNPVTSVITNNNLSINSIPDVMIYGDAFVCAGSQSEYSAGTEPNGTYKWTVLQGGSIVGDFNKSDVVVKWDTTKRIGILQLIKQNEAGCSDTNELEITIAPLPKNLAITGDSIVCKNSVSTYSVPVENGTSCIWKAINGDIIDNSLNRIVFIKWTEAGHGRLKLIKAFSSTGCRDSSEIEITINPLPDMSIIGSKRVCQNRIVTYSVKPEEDIANKWIAENGGFKSGDSSEVALISWNLSGQKLLTLIRTDTISFCSDTNTINIEINPLPNTEITGTFNVLINNEYEYSVPAMPNTKYYWIVEGGEIVTGVNQPKLKVIWKNIKDARLTVIAESLESGCIDTNSVKINSYEFDEIDIQGELSVCESDTLIYRTEKNSKYKYKWKTNNCTIIDDSKETELIVSFSKSGIARIELLRELIATGDKDSAFIEIRVFAKPELVITYFGKEKLCPDDSVILDAGEHYKYKWSDGSSNRRLVVFSEGTYSATVTNEANCSTSKKIFVETAPIINPLIEKHGDTLICITEALEYKWFKDGERDTDESNNFIVLTGSGEHSWQVAIIDTNGCYSISAPIITNINEVSVNDNKVNVIPNPAYDRILIEVNLQEISNVLLSIVDIYGKPLLVKEITGSYNEFLNISNYASGTYFIRLSYIEGCIVRKFVKI